MKTILSLTLGCSLIGLFQAGQVIPGRHLLLIFDPTVQSTEPDRFINAFAGFLATSINENERVSVWLVSDRVMQHPQPAATQMFRLHQAADGRARHVKDVEHWVNGTVVPVLTNAWRAAQQPPKVGGRQTCLLTALYAVSEHVTQASDRTQLDLIVLSDLLEVCRDWGTVHMERDLTAGRSSYGEDLRSAEAQQLIRLDRINRLFVLHHPTRYVTSPVQRRAVQGAWREALKAFGFPNAVQFFAGIPDQPAAGRWPAPIDDFD